jgi:hypothetical protein
MSMTPGATIHFKDQYILSAAHGLSPGDWILEVKVLGETDAEEETMEQVEFHPNQECRIFNPREKGIRIVMHFLFDK